MKYATEILIKAPRKEVVEKFSNPEYMKHWQRGFIYIKPITGTSGEAGSQNLLKYKMGKREIEMKETITKNDLPASFSATYEAKGVYNIQENRFTEPEAGQTKWISENEFRFSGFMKVFVWLMPGAFKKQSYQYMKDFKAFVEDEKSVLDS